MEDQNKLKEISKYFFVIIIILIIVLIGLFSYQQFQISTNTNRLYTYLKSNNYSKSKNGYYTKEIKNDNQTITEISGAKEYLFAEKKITLTNQEFINIFLEYTKDNKVNISYKMEGYNKNQQIATIIQEGNLKKGNFDCKIISNNNFDTACDVMKKEAENYYEKINKILKDNKINLKYVKSQAKKTSKF